MPEREVEERLPWRVDEIEEILLSIMGVSHTGGLSFDGDAFEHISKLSQINRRIKDLFLFRLLAYRGLAYCLLLRRLCQ